MEPSASTTIFTPTNILIGIALIVIAAIIIIALIRWGLRDDDEQKKQSSRPDQPPATSADRSTTYPQPTSSSKKVSPIEELKARIRAARSSGRNLKDYFEEVVNKFIDSLTIEDALEACISLDFEDSEIAALLDSLGYTLNELAVKIEEEYTESAEEWITLLVSFSKASTPADKCTKAIEALEYAGINIDSVFVKPLIENGMTEEEAIKIVYEKSSETMWEVLDNSGLETDPAKLALIAKQCEVDLSDSDEYQKLREGMKFDEAIIVLRGLGKDLSEIVATENGYDTIDNDGIDEILKSLKAAGYPVVEILSALINDSDTEAYLAGVISSLENGTVSENEFVEFAIADDTDPSDIDSEFNEQEIDLKLKTRILHLLFTALDKKTQDNSIKG